MKNRINTLFFVLFICVLSLFAMNDYLVADFPYTHDGENHLARFANYKIAIKEGQFPPRWAPNLHNRYGYPVLNYNYPLANILSLPFSVIKIEYEFTFKLLTFTSLFFGGLGVYLLSKELFPKVEKSAHLFSTLVWFVQPYLHNLLIFRGTIGETMAIALLPHIAYLILLCKRKLSTKEFTYGFLVVSSFLLSHNITVLFGGFLLGLFAIFVYRKDWKLWRRLLSFSLPALGSTLWFWLPALMEKNQVILDRVDLFAVVPDHLLSVQQLFFSPLAFGYSLKGPVDSLGFSLGLINIVSLVLVLVTFFSFNTFKKNKIILVSVVAVAALLLLQTKSFELLWVAAPLLGYIQFPWRLSMFLSLLMIPVATYIWSIGTSKLKWLLTIVFLLSFQSIYNLKPVDYFHKTTVDYDAFSQTTSTQNENFPKTFKYSDIADWQPTAEIIEGEGKVTVQFWTGSKRQYEVIADTEVTVVEPTANFLGWETNSIDANSTEINLEYVDSDLIQGRIAYELKPGSHQVKTKFSQNTWARIVGNWVSVFSFVFITAVILSVYVRNKVTTYLSKDLLDITEGETY